MSPPASSSPLPAWSMVKRLPTYMKLAWLLIKEPAIPTRHKMPLYLVALYEISPPHLLIAAVPVLGQFDSVILLLLGLRHALSHCPPKVVARHLSKLSLTLAQMSEDWEVISAVGGVVRRNTVAGESARGIAAKLRFAGRVAQGFTNRRIERLLVGPA